MAANSGKSSAANANAVSDRITRSMPAGGVPRQPGPAIRNRPAPLPVSRVPRYAKLCV